MKDRFLYEEVAGQVAQLVREGTLGPGDRVPSVRQMSRERGISVSTVLQAYRLLEDRGVIEAQPRSGYYVRPQPRRRLEEPGTSRPSRSGCTVSVCELIVEVLEAVSDPGAASLGAAVIDPSLLPVDALNRALRRVAGGAETTAYLPFGSEALRQAVARRGMLAGCRFTHHDVVVTNGCTEALALSLRAVAEPGSTVAVESPTYFGLLQILDSLDLRAVEVPTHPREGICLDALGAVLEREPVSACLLMPNFHNPLGSLMPDENKRALLALLGRHDVPLVEDDLYGDLYFGPARPRPVKAFDEDGRVLHCGSFSKTLAPGFRVGWVVPGRYHAQVKRLKYASTLATSAPAQLALAEYLDGSGYDRHLRRLRRALATNVARLTEAVARAFPEGTRVTRPQGGFVLWIEMPESVDGTELFRMAHRARISVAPGSIFSAGGGHRSSLRLNAGRPWSARLEDAVETLGRLAARLAGTAPAAGGRNGSSR